MRTLIVLSAIPGSGKSTWARKYQKEHQNTYIVASDEIRYEFFGAVNDFRNEKLVWGTFLYRINRYAETLNDVTVIADATNLQNKYRRMYAELTPKFEKHILVRFNVPYDICLLQNKMREKERIVPEDAMLRLQAEMEEPDQATLAFYNEYRVVSNFLSKEARQEERKQKPASEH
jgi:predicted kinase